MRYVQFARGRYAVGVTVPEELRDIIGKRELVEPLGGDKKMAERHAHGVIAGFLAQIEDAHELLKARAPRIETVARQHYQSELASDDAFRSRFEELMANLPGEPIDPLPQWARDLRRFVSGDLSVDEAEAHIGPIADRWAKQVPGHGLSRLDLLKLVALVELDLAGALEARGGGAIALPEPSLAILRTAEPDPVDSTPPAGSRNIGPTLDDVLVAFHQERTAGHRTLADKTMEEHKVAVRMFNEFAGEGIPVRSITRKQLLDYKQALLQTPARYAVRFKGLTLPQAIKANQRRKTPFPTLDPQTINVKWLSHLSTIFKWAANNGFVNDNPAAGVRVDEGKGYKEPSRVPFSPDDLSRIFGGPIYRDTPRRKWDTRQWALLLALYTGARSSSELARIRLEDIYKEGGVDVINLALASKNRRSKRLVPVHRHLVELGFLDYVERLRRRNSSRLFPEWDPEDRINRWFLRSYRQEVGIVDERKVFHSFRHTLKTALARYGVSRDVSDLITGHADQTVAGAYIADKSVTMVQWMKEGLDRVTFKLPLLDHNNRIKSI